MTTGAHCAVLGRHRQALALAAPSSRCTFLRSFTCAGIGVVAVALATRH